MIEPKDTCNMHLVAQDITADTLLEKYCKGDETTEDAIFKRTAKGVASVEKTDKLRKEWETKFYLNMVKGAIGGGRIMAAAGTDIKATLINCFIQPISDSIQDEDKDGYPGIYVALKEAAETMRRGGGVGYDFSRIRPKNAEVKGTGSFASGPCSYIDVFDVSCKTVESAGCFAGDTLISTTEGLMRIKDIVESDKDWYVNTHVGPRKVTTKFRNGVKDIWHVITKHGYTVKVTPEHKFAQVENGKIITKSLKDIWFSKDHGLLLLTPRGKDFEPEWSLAEKEAYLIGAFQGNGSWCYNDDKTKVKGISIANHTNKEATISRLENFAKDLGLNPNVKKRTNEECVITTAYSVEFFGDWCNRGVNKGMDMQVPEFILKASEQVRAAYVAGLMDADGSVSETKSNIRLRLITPKLLKNVQIILADFGIPATIKLDRDERDNWKAIHCLGIYGALAQLRFNKTVGKFMIKTLSNLATRDKVGYGHPWNIIKQFCDQKSLFNKYWTGNEYTHPNISATGVNAVLDFPELINTISDEIRWIVKQPAEETYDLEVDEVHLLSGDGIYTSNSRRGAQLSATRIDHPDIEEYITAKRTPGRWNNFNVSVFVTDDFMEAVNTNSKWQLVHKAKPTKFLIDKGAYQREDGLWVYKEVNAKELWDTIMKSNYDFAEPGILFGDNINNDNNLRYCEVIETTNPCVTGDTVILTDQGYVRIDSVVDQEVQIWNGFEWSYVTPKVTAENQEIIDFEFSDGTKLSCTPYHKFILSDGSRIEAKDLQLSSKLAKFNFPVVQGSQYVDSKTAYTQGFYSGDGQAGTKRIWLYNEKCNLVPQLAISALSDQSTDTVTRLMATMDSQPESKNFVPDSQYTIETRLAWLAGLIDSDGSCSDSAVTIWSVDRDFLIKVKLLLNTLGATGIVSLGKKAGPKLLPNGQNGFSSYNCQDCWRLSISGGNMINLKALGIMPNRVNIWKHIYKENSHFIQPTFKQIRSNLEPKVYCFNEEKNHSGIFNGIMTANCGEQPLPPYGCCDLGPIILTKFVNNPFTKEAAFDFKSLIEVVKVQTRFLDNVLDVTHWPLEQQKAEAMAKRRIGIGFTGLGDALIMLGLKYNSEEGRTVASEICLIMKEAAYISSVELAKEKGAFPLFDADKYLEKGTFASRLNDKIKADIRKYGIRNSHLLSTAPTGTVSLAFADNASNGIEPPFSLAYIRKKRLQHGGHQEYVVVDHALRVYLSTLDKTAAEVILTAISTGKKEATIYGVTKTIKEWLPDSFITALEMSAEDHLLMMAAVQPHVDSSISKTVNCPADYPFEDFKSIYDKAHKYGLKGVATYRPNSILGSVLSEIKPEEAPVVTLEDPSTVFDTFMSTDHPKRPSGRLSGFSDKFEYFNTEGGVKFYIGVSFIDKDVELPDGSFIHVRRPIELFINSEMNVGNEWGKLLGITLSQIARTSIFKLAEYLKTCQKMRGDRGSIRFGFINKPDGGKAPRYHGSDIAVMAYAIQELLHSVGILDKHGDPVQFKDIISNEQAPVLNYVNEETLTEIESEAVVATGSICTECGSPSVVKRDGCKFCTSCGWEGACG